MVLPQCEMPCTNVAESCRGLSEALPLSGRACKDACKTLDAQTARSEDVTQHHSLYNCALLLALFDH